MMMTFQQLCRQSMPLWLLMCLPHTERKHRNNDNESDNVSTPSLPLVDPDVASVDDNNENDNNDNNKDNNNCTKPTPLVKLAAGSDVSIAGTSNKTRSFGGNVLESESKPGKSHTLLNRSAHSFRNIIISRNKPQQQLCLVAQGLQRLQASSTHPLTQWSKCCEFSTFNSDRCSISCTAFNNISNAAANEPLLRQQIHQLL